MTSADLFSPRFLQFTALDPLPVVDRCIVRVRVF